MAGATCSYLKCSILKTALGLISMVRASKRLLRRSCNAQAELSLSEKIRDWARFLDGDIGPGWSVRLIAESTVAGGTVLTYEQSDGLLYVTQIKGRGAKGRFWSDSAYEAMAVHMGVVSEL